MTIVKKYTKGKAKGWNIRQRKNSTFSIFRGNVCQFENLKTLSDAMDTLFAHLG